MDSRCMKKLPLVMSCMYSGIMSYCAFLDPYSRQRLNPEQRLLQWGDMFRTSLVPMAALSAGTSIAGFIQYHQTKNIGWAVGSAIFAAILPYTMFILRPIFSRLLEAERRGDTKQTDKGISLWLGVYKFRLLLAVAASAFFIYAEVNDQLPKLEITI